MGNPRVRVAEGIERIIDGAFSHGELSEPDHEIGDLQTALRACWERMTHEQRKAVLSDPWVEEILEWRA